jgi:hypothetical protein
MQAEIAALRDNRAAWVDRAATSDMTAARLSVDLSAAKELLRECRSYMQMPGFGMLPRKIDAFLQEKP